MAIAKAYEYFLSCINHSNMSVKDAIDETVQIYSHEGIGYSELESYIKHWGEISI